MRGTHPEQYDSPLDSPFEFAKKNELKTDTFDDFLNVINAIFEEAIASDCVCLKSTQAYERNLTYRKISKERRECLRQIAPDDHRRRTARLRRLHVLAHLQAERGV